jgi:biopolymer transport protein TolR
VANIKDTTEEERVSVSINAEERVYLNERPVALPILVDQLRGMMEGRENKVVYLRADEGLRYGKVIEVVDTIKQAGVEQIGFVYQLPSEKTPR